MNSDGGKLNLFVPGRLCLFGEHTDWAAEYGLSRGYCLVTGTDQGLHAEVRRSRSFVVETLMPDHLGRPSGRTRQMVCRWEPQMLLAAAQDKGEFFRYCAGVAFHMSGRAGVRGGLELKITSMDLPLRKGVSSSAAVCILVAKAFDAVYGLNMFPHELMEVAYLGEKLTGSQCGRMDQACIYGKTPVLLTFQKSADVHIEPIFPAKDIHMFFVDMAGQKDTVKILADLQRAYPSSKNLQACLGAGNEEIVRGAYRALCDGDAQRLGKLMTQAQKRFDAQVRPHSPQQLASPLLHKLLAFKPIQPHIYGGKGVGSQGDGTAQFTARGPGDRDDAMAKIEKAFPQMRCFPLTIPARAQEGRKA